jgi:hypothetical protein
VVDERSNSRISGATLEESEIGTSGSTNCNADATAASRSGWANP